MASNSSLSEADVSALKAYGRDTITNVTGIAVESVFCGVYGVFFAVAMYSICRQGLRSRRAIIMSLVVVYLFAASVTQYALDCFITFKNIHILFISDIPLPDRANVADVVLNKIAHWLEPFFATS
ncbi:hypothetical protein C8R45DRAFT_1215129, partial [Mycena sanguinolenta]